MQKAPHLPVLSLGLIQVCKDWRLLWCLCVAAFAELWAVLVPSTPHLP